MATTLALFCLVDGQSTSQAFEVEIDRNASISRLKDAIFDKIDNTGILAKDLTLWRVSNPVVAGEPISIETIESRTELIPTDDISEYFSDQPPKKTIHVLVERPQGGQGMSISLSYWTDGY